MVRTNVESYKRGYTIALGGEAMTYYPDYLFQLLHESVICN